MRLVLDIETTYQVLPGKTDPSPYNALNRIVSIGTLDIDTKEEKYVFINHSDGPDNIESINRYMEYVAKADVIIGHNLKFDISWLLECGFTINAKLYDTMIVEYILAKGQKPVLSLANCALKYGLTPKLDIFKTYKDKGVNTDSIPKAELEEYGLGDIRTTFELYNLQQGLLDTEYKSVKPAISLSFDVLPILIDMERNGISIDTDALEVVRKQYQEELNILETNLNALVIDVMGHRRINLSSPEHLSWIIYSRRVHNKPQWANVLNLGVETRGSVTKRKYPARLYKDELKRLIADCMETLYKQEAKQCQACVGKGKIRKLKKDGSDFKKESACPDCMGSGYIYSNLPEIAGFKVQPLGSIYGTVAGFSTDKDTILELLKLPSLSENARLFLGYLSRYNAVQTYLNTFVEGISKNTNADSLLHTTFNQCITATGRLSSSNPNFQNLPRGKTFPVRRTIRSRFAGGCILEADFAQLEFRTAAILSKCPVALLSILNNEDIHNYTAKVLTEAGQPTDRQEAKSHTFKPLYGGLSGTKAEVTYYKDFLKKYEGINDWQTEIVNTVLSTKELQIPSGRIYAFPNVKRLGADRVLGKTQIVNYPVQGFATADIVWVVIKEIYKNLKGMKSCLILQVHDSIVCDVHPQEKEEVLKIFQNAFDNANFYLEREFNIQTQVPIGYEMKIGNNLLEMQKCA